MKVLFWIFVAIGCVYVFYTGAMALWSYLEITSVVEEVVNERATRTDRQVLASRVRDDIAKKVAASGINVDERAISVSDEGKTLEVSVRWSWPVIVYQERQYLAVPLKHRARLSWFPTGAESALGLGLANQLRHMVSVLARRRQRDELLPGADRSGHVALGLVEHLPPIEERRQVVRVDRERALEDLERTIGVVGPPAERQDQAEMGRRVHVVRVALEDGLVGRNRLVVASLGEARAGGLQHAAKHFRG